jgi:hypothetical protein
MTSATEIHSESSATAVPDHVAIERIATLTQSDVLSLHSLTRVMRQFADSPEKDVVLWMIRRVLGGEMYIGDMDKALGELTIRHGHTRSDT